MKKKLSLLAASALLFGASAPVMGSLSDWGVSPLIGVDTEIRHTPFRKHYGGDLFKKNYFEGNLYAGLRFLDYLGLELGYERISRKSSSSVSGPGSVEFNLRVPQNTIRYSVNTFKIHGPHVDLVGYFPFCICDEKFDFLASVGAVNLTASFIHQPTGEDFTATSLNRREIHRLRAEFKKRKTVLKAKVGFQYWMIDHAGVRATIGYENTSRLNHIAPKHWVDGHAHHHASHAHHLTHALLRAGLKDTILYSLGIFWQF